MVSAARPTVLPPPRLAIGRFLRGGPPDPPRIEAFLAGQAFPIVEGPHCTFVYHGPADAVHLRHWIYGLSSTQAFERVADSDLWYLVLELPEGSRVEYKLEVSQGADIHLVADPLNPEVARDPFGANSVCHASGYAVPEWTKPDPDVPAGTLEDVEFESGVYGVARRVTLYRPARFRPSRRYPLLVVHDGPDYLRFSGLQAVLDNLIDGLEIAEVVAACLHPVDRLEEYGASEQHSKWLAQELVPQLEDCLPLIATPQGRCLLGASFGGVASFAAATHYPHFYGRLLLQSGSFAFTDIGEGDRGPLFDPVVEFMNTFREEPRPVADQVFVSCGIYESLIYENRSLVPVLQSTGMRVKYVESRDGHNWESWRDRLREGLSWLYPGPLWMVYD